MKLTINYLPNETITREMNVEESIKFRDFLNDNESWNSGRGGIKAPLYYSFQCDDKTIAIMHSAITSIIME